MQTLTTQAIVLAAGAAPVRAAAARAGRDRLPDLRHLVGPARAAAAPRRARRRADRLRAGAGLRPARRAGDADRDGAAAADARGRRGVGAGAGRARGRRRARARPATRRCAASATARRRRSSSSARAARELRIEFDELLCAVGRVARLEGYGLEELGIPVRARTVETNEYLQTLYPNILAAGDVAGPYQFTHVAAHQAWYAAVNGLFGGFKKFKADYSVIPWRDLHRARGRARRAERAARRRSRASRTRSRATASPSWTAPSPTARTEASSRC